MQSAAPARAIGGAHGSPPRANPLSPQRSAGRGSGRGDAHRQNTTQELPLSSRTPPLPSPLLHFANGGEGERSRCASFHMREWTFPLTRRRGAGGGRGLPLFFLPRRGPCRRPRFSYCFTWFPDPTAGNGRRGRASLPPARARSWRTRAVPSRSAGGSDSRPGTRRAAGRCRRWR